MIKDILLERVGRLAKVAVQGTLVEVRVRCGVKSCRCHRAKKYRHGPHTYLKFRNPQGRSTGLYVAPARRAQARRAVAAWKKLREALVRVSDRNRETLRGGGR